MKNTVRINLLFFCLVSWFTTGGMLSTEAYANRSASVEWSIMEHTFSSALACSTPTWPSTSNITQTSATFGWSPVSGAQSYTIQTRLPNGTWYDAPGGPFYSTTVTVSGFNPGTTYEWRVRANCNYWEYSSWTYPVTFTTLGSYSCNAPSWLSTTNITQSSATFNWASVYGANSYSIQWRLAGGTWWDLPGGPWTNPSLDIYNLQSGTSYEWRVRSNCSNGTSNWSYAAAFTTLGGYSCSAPSWLATNNITQTSATLDWAPVSGANSYSLQYRISGGSWWDVNGGPFSSTWYTLTGLQPGTTYEWRVRANCYNGTSNWSYPATFTTLGYSCSAPSWLYTNNITQNSATLDWAPVSGAISYSLQYRLAGGTWWDVSGGPFNSTWYTLTGLQPGTAYEWRVRSNCSNWTYSAWSYPASFTTLGGYACTAPSWLYTNNITQNSATLDWAPVNGAISYSLQYRLAGGTWWDVSGGPFNGTWYTLTGLQPGTAYEWRVRSNCSNWTYSAWSYPASFTTLGGYYCTAPSWLYTSNITQNSATLDWEPVSGAINYSLQYRLAGGTWWDVSGGPFNGTWYTLTGLQSGTAYEWRVRSNCSNWTYSAWSYPASFTTLSGYSCTAPSWLYTNNITQNSATLDWAPVNGAINYSLQYRLAGGTWWDVSGGPFNGTWYTLTGLQPGTAYEWRVRSNCSNWTYSAWSYPASFTTLGYSCSTPTWPITSNITQTTATFSWDPVYGAQSYSIQTRLPNGTWYDVPGGPFYSTAVTVNGFSPGTTYEWRVRANCSNWQYSNWTYPTTFTTLGTYNCDAPYWLYASDITQTSAKLSWNAVSGAISYSIQIRVSGGNWWDVAGGPFTGTWHTVTGLNPGTTYQWRVRSNCYDWNYSQWSYSSSFTTLGYSCSMPTWPITSNITQTTATFNWDAVYGAQSYSVQTRLPNGTWYDAPGGPIYNTWVTVTGFNPGTTYEWRVRANCSGGSYSNWTYPVTFTTLGGYYCNPPSWLATNNITQTSATLDWAPVNGAVSYSLQYRLAGGTWWDVSGGPFYSTWYTLTGLQPGTTYEWRVRTTCSDWSYSAWSYPSSFTTLGSGYGCNTPTWPTTSNIMQTSATFSWSAVYGAQSYTVQTRLLNGTWYDAPNSPFYTTSVTVGGFLPNTTYQWRVRTNCSGGQYSDWTWPTTFTTTGSYGGGGNDNCDNATVLWVESFCSSTSSSNVNATASYPAPVGGCSPQSYKDVWFKFTMPGGYNPNVTIRATAGSLADGVMEVYHGSSCSNLSYITCEDDNIDGNGSMMPVINLEGYAGSTIWVRFWGYWGTTGTFSICVFNYQSNNFSVTDEEITPFAGEEIEISETGVEVMEFEKAIDEIPTLFVSPNPAYEVLNISMAQTIETKVSSVVLHDLSGKVVARKDYSSRDTEKFLEQLDVSRLTPGMYVLQIITTSGILSEKVMVVQ